jgi:hypothetical protein
MDNIYSIYDHKKFFQPRTMFAYIVDSVTADWLWVVERKSRELITVLFDNVIAKGIRGRSFRR